jgi:hypothetical protein
MTVQKIDQSPKGSVSTVVLWDFRRLSSCKQVDRQIRTNQPTNHTAQLLTLRLRMGHRLDAWHPAERRHGALHMDGVWVWVFDWNV